MLCSNKPAIRSHKLCVFVLKQACKAAAVHYDHICKAAAVHLSKPAKLQLSICSNWQSVSQHIPNPAKLHLIVYNVRLPARSKLLPHCYTHARTIVTESQLQICSSLHRNAKLQFYTFQAACTKTAAIYVPSCKPAQLQLCICCTKTFKLP